MGRLCYLILIFEPIEYAPLRSIFDQAITKYQKGLKSMEVSDEYQEEKDFLINEFDQYLKLQKEKQHSKSKKVK